MNNNRHVPTPSRSRHLALAVITASSAVLAACQTGIQTDTPAPIAPSHIATIELSNYSSFSRYNESLYFSYYTLGLAEHAAETQQLAALVGEQLVPSQAVDIDGDGQNDGLAVDISIAPEATKTLTIIADTIKSKTVFKKFTQAEISKKTQGEWAPHTKSPDFKAYSGGHFENVEQLTPPQHYTDHSNWIRYEGPGIESDKVAYRVYLDWRNGFDIFGKTSNEPVLQKIGQDGYESYHHRQDWGMDILKVGESLGAGGFGYWNGQKVEGIEQAEQRSATITNNGPIVSSFNIHYKNARIADAPVDINAHITMVNGSRLAHNHIRLSEAVPNLAIGVVKHKDTQFIRGSLDIPGDSYTYIGSWGKQSLNNDHLGMAVIFQKRDFNKTVDDKNSYTAVMRARGNELSYYFVAAWEGEHGVGIANEADFISYLEQETEKLTIKLRQRVKTSRSIAEKKATTTPQQALNWSIKLADSELQRKTLLYHYNGWDTHRKRSPKFEYDIVGMLPLTYAMLAKETGNAAYADVLSTVTASYIQDDGAIHAYKYSNYNIDSVAPGRAVLELYAQTGEEKYKTAASKLRHQLENQPRTQEGAFWHKKKYDSQLWLDGVYMGMPFLAQYSSLFEDGASLDEVVNEFELTRQYLRDPNSGLYYHAWDEKKQQIWADRDTGLSPHFWARGMGWLSMGLVDVLDHIPEDDSEHRVPLLQMVQEIADSLLKVQDKATSTWWQIIDQPQAPGNYRESSATAMFTYFFAKAVRLGYLPKSYKTHALQSYDGLINEFVNVHADGSISMTNQCLVAGLGFGRDGSYRYYMSERIFENDPKGTAPFMLAGIEISKLLKR